MPYTVPIARARKRAASLQKRPTVSLPYRPAVADPVGNNESLLDEAIAIAWRLGRHIVHREGGRSASGVVWSRGRKHLVLSGPLPTSEKLAWVAQLLDGDPRLAWVDMSADLAAYLNPRRAA